METNANRLRKYSGITLGIVLVTAFVLVQPTMQISYAQVSDEGVPDYDTCTFSDSDSGVGSQSQHSWSMNTVRNKDVAKTIIVEKEVFRCQTVQGDIFITLEVDVYAEIYENMTTKSIIAKQNHVVSCAKLEADDTVLGCDTYKPKTDFIPVNGCFPLNYNEDRQEMNTVNKGNIVKTIVAEKQLSRCNFTTSSQDDDKKIEQYIITETWENLSLLPGDAVVQKNVESLRCWTLITTAIVESCQFTTVQLQEVDPFE